MCVVPVLARLHPLCVERLCWLNRGCGDEIAYTEKARVFYCNRWQKSRWTGEQGGPFAAESLSVWRLGYGVRQVIELQFLFGLKFIWLAPTFNLRHKHLSASQRESAL